MALSDMRDKLATAEDYLMTAPLSSEQWTAALDHLRWLWRQGESRAEVRRIVERMSAARAGEPGLPAAPFTGSGDPGAL